MSAHKWGPRSKSYPHMRTCARCGVRQQRPHDTTFWQPKPGVGWRRGTGPRACQDGGGASDGPTRCTHVDRVSIHLEHGHTVRGGFKVGQCEREALPRMVVCGEHATPDALRMVIMSMSAEIERLTSGG